jgi:hypothetical protein
MWQEQIYAILRATGWPSARMDLAGWKLGPTERFLVSVPIANVNLTRERNIAGVTFTPVNPCDAGLPKTEVGAIFSGALAWATTPVDAETMFDAEVRGLEKIDFGVSSLRALGAYRFPTYRSKARPFKRHQARARVQMIGVSYVVADTGRRWLRQVGKLEPTEPLEVDILVPDEIRDFLDTSSDQMLNRSVREWRAAVDSGEDYERIAHLWRSIECYANHHSEGPLFSKEERGTIRSALSAANSWSEKQSERLAGMGGLPSAREISAGARSRRHRSEFGRVRADHLNSASSKRPGARESSDGAGTSSCGQRNRCHELRDRVSYFAIGLRSCFGCRKVIDTETTRQSCGNPNKMSASGNVNPSIASRTRSLQLIPSGVTWSIARADQH